MKKYIKSSQSSGYVGIWWICDNNKLIGKAIPTDSGYNDGYYIQYDEFKNHSTEWRSVLKDNGLVDDLYAKGYKSIERGRVIYNIKTRCYEILCSEAVSKDIEKIKQIVCTYHLESLRYDIVPIAHYHIAPLTGNPALDGFEYGAF